MTDKRFCVRVFDDKVIHGFAVLDLQKPDSRLRLKYESVYIGSKEGCEIVCKFGNSLADENEQLKQDIEYWKQVASQYSNELNVFEHKHNEDKHIHWSSG